MTLLHVDKAVGSVESPTETPRSDILLRLGAFVFLSFIGSLGCGKGGATSGTEPAASAATSGVIEVRPQSPPPDALLDPDRLPWHLEEEAKAQMEVTATTYRAQLEAMEKEFEALPVITRDAGR